MLVRLDPASSTPIFTQLAESVRGALGRGELRAGERLPAAREMAAALEINVHTVLHAYQELRDEGIVELRRGRGAVITEQGARSTTLASAVAALVDSARAAGVGPETLASLIREEYRP